MRPWGHWASVQGLREGQPCTWLALVRSIGRALDNQELKRAQKSSVQQKVTGIAEPWDSVVQGQDSGCVPWPLHATGAWKIGARERTEHTLRRNTSHGPRYIQKPRMTHKPAPCSDCCLQTCLIPLVFCHLQSIFFLITLETILFYASCFLHFIRWGVHTTLMGNILHYSTAVKELSIVLHQNRLTFSFQGPQAF